MKKKVFYIVLILIGILITGCNKSDNKSNSIILSVKKETVTNVGASFVIKNNTNELYTYGESYFLEKENDGNWNKVEIKENLLFNAIAYNIKPGEKKEFSINWKYGYGKLESGKYRLVKDIFKDSNRPIDESDKEYIYAEFIIR